MKNQRAKSGLAGATSLITLVLFVFLALVEPASGRPITAAGGPAVLNIYAAGSNSIRITLKPASFKPEFPVTPILPDRRYPRPTLTLREIKKPVKATVAGLLIEVQPEPFRIVVKGNDGAMIQTLTFQDDGSVAFALDEQPVLGMGEGGPKPGPGNDWRKAPVEFDRRGHLDTMQPRWQGDAYGSRNPVPLMVGTRGWALYFASPWGQVDLSQTNAGRFVPIKAVDSTKMRQTAQNQNTQLGKGIPPMESIVPGLLDIFVFDAREPITFMTDLAAITGPAVMPPKWALGYMQSHRTLEDDEHMVSEVDMFREKRIPVDAVIYLGTGFTPRGWNTPQPSFDFNPAVFKHNPADVIADLHKRNVKVALHMVPWDRDKLPALQGTIPPKKGEIVDSSHIANYWQQHIPLVKTGVDAWWPDEGDWFDLFERMKRHQLYYQGPIATQPDRRPWDLQRNGYLGIARWGGWIWSGDTLSTWKTLEAQIAVGINSSLSLSPYWGSDIGGFTSTRELTGELYTRWFQFAAFCPSFRAHGRTWWTRLPWGWGLSEFGPVEDREPPLTSELNNPAVEPIAKRYDELRYQLLSYNYTLAWQAREKGLPLMRALWLHYPDDERARGIGSEYLWGRDLLIAPVFEKGATNREVYLPKGSWYDWWTGDMQTGGQMVSRKVDLATMPIYVRAGTILPIDPVQQFTGEKAEIPLTIRIYRGANGDYTLYEDDGESLAYLKGDAVLARFQWDDATARLTVRRRELASHTHLPKNKFVQIEIFPGGQRKNVECTDRVVRVDFSEK